MKTAFRKLGATSALYIMLVIALGIILYGVCHQNPVELFVKDNIKVAKYLKIQRPKDFLEKGGAYVQNYENPRTLNEKIAYILDNYYLHSPITYIIGNKYYTKKFVADIVGEEHVVKLYGAWKTPTQIEWDKLPNKFVLKTVRGHRGHQVIVVSDKSKTDIFAVTKKLEKFLDNGYIKKYGHYKVIAEELLDLSEGAGVDYKFFCSYGKPLFAYCSVTDQADDLNSHLKSFSWYTIPDWTRIPVDTDQHANNLVSKPKHFDQMIKIAQELSKLFPLVRIDLYEIGDRVLVGEITEDSCGGKFILNPLKWDAIFGDMIAVPTKEEIKTLIKRDQKLYKKWL